jgi:hypothetical protein
VKHLIPVMAFCTAGIAHANTVTFDFPANWTAVEPGVFSYIEDGMRVLWYSEDGCVPVYGGPPPVPCGGQGVIPNGSGWALSTRNFVDILFEPVDGGAFTPTGMDFLGGIDTRFGGFYPGDFQAGGQVPNTQLLLNPGGSGSIVFGSSWNNIAVIDWCDYCIEFGYNGGAIDNLTFNLASPEPYGALLSSVGVLLIALAAGKRRTRWRLEVRRRRGSA